MPPVTAPSSAAQVRSVGAQRSCGHGCGCAGASEGAADLGTSLTSWSPCRYNATLKGEFGASAATAIADTDNGGLSQFAPFVFIMQTVGQMMLLLYG